MFRTNKEVTVFPKNVLIPSKVRKWVQAKKKKIKRVKFVPGPSIKLLSPHSADDYPESAPCINNADRSDILLMAMAIRQIKAQCRFNLPNDLIASNEGFSNFMVLTYSG